MPPRPGRGQQGAEGQASSGSPLDSTGPGGCEDSHPRRLEGGAGGGGESQEQHVREPY